jgi:two-component system, sensor histidine kinase RpfC
MAFDKGVLGLPEGMVHNTEFQSALVRMAVWIFGAGYIALAAVTGYYRVDVPYFLSLLTIFTLVYVGIFVSVLRRPEWNARRYVALSLDIVAISLAIFITREAISPFYLLYIWIFISAGTRYGTSHLILASVEAVFAYSLVLIALDQWTKHTFEAVFFLLLLVLLPLYQYALVRRVQQAKDEAERANKAKGDFLAFMTHELRTPLTGVVGMTELLKTTNLDGEQRDYVQGISNSAAVLGALIGDILDFSKIDAERLKLEQVSFDLRSVVREVGGVLESLALAGGTEMICYVAPEVPATVTGDQLRVRQILFNLLGNAVKFTEDGQVEVRVGVRPAEAGVDQAHLLLEIEDTGIGIPADKLPHIFESFSQADISTTRRFGGSGLGTTIARQLVLLMHGTIGVDSVEGQGSRFWVRLPLLGSELPQEQPPGGCLKGRRALVLEHNQTQRERVCDALAREGVHCRAVAAAGDLPALGLRAADLDLVVIADHLRRFDLAALRAEVNAVLGGEPPCLFLTCAARPFEGQGAAVRYLGKPCLGTDLTAGVERLLGLAPDADAPTPTAAGLGPCAAGGTIREVRVLVAEDNEIAAKVITTFLKKMGYPYIRVADGEEALREALAGDYGIAVIDLRMPKLDGVEFARRYRAQAPERPLPIVALTANASEDVKQACLEAGMDAFLAKPVSPDLLRQTIETMARRGGSSAGAGETGLG